MHRSRAVARRPFFPRYTVRMKKYSFEKSGLNYFLTADPRMAWFWLIVRVYLGYMWLEAGLEKMTNPAWFGANAGPAMTGFVQKALTKTAEFCPPAPAACHPDVQSWYAAFLEGVVLPNAFLWSHAIVLGEIAVGIALILGVLTGLAAFFGVFMNLNFMLAGTVSVNPIMATLGVGLMLAHRIAGYWGLDRYIRPFLRYFSRSG